MKKLLSILFIACSLSAFAQTKLGDIPVVAWNPPAAPLGAAEAGSATVAPAASKQSFLSKAKAYASRADTDLFGKETTVDLGVSYTIAEPGGLRNVAHTDADHGDWGIGLSAMQWPNKFTGFGFAAGIRDWNNVRSEVLDYAATTFALRYPIKRFAPGVIGAVGRDWADGLYYFQAGPRLDVRWNQNIGAFVQAPFTFRTAETRDSLDVQFGVTIAFRDFNVFRR